VLTDIDLAVLRAIYVGGRSPVWFWIAAAITSLGSGWMILGLLPFFRRPAWRPATAALIAALLATSGVVAALKLAVGRARPFVAHPWARVLGLQFPSDHSFPSGHAAGSFAFAAFVAQVSPRHRWGLLALASAIAVSRVALGVHYPSDVLVGALLGAAIGYSSARGLSRWREHRAASSAPPRSDAPVARSGPGRKPVDYASQLVEQRMVEATEYDEPEPDSSARGADDERR
jgi:undecaprenyl-diphosphatase